MDLYVWTLIWLHAAYLRNISTPERERGEIVTRTCTGRQDSIAKFGDYPVRTTCCFSFYKVLISFAGDACLYPLLK
jgi:hypothetical protein